MSNEIAHTGKKLDQSIVDAAFQAAQAYPFLKIKCPWCRQSVPGSEFKEHGEEHVKKEKV